MELSELLSKEAEIKDQIEQLNQEIENKKKELGKLYASALCGDFVWDSAEQKWYKDAE